MNEFTIEQTQRWEAWLRSGAVSARRSEQIYRGVAATIFLALLTALGVAMWRL